MKNKDLQNECMISLKKQYEGEIAELKKALEHQKLLTQTYKNAIGKSQIQIIDDCNKQIEKILMQKDLLHKNLVHKYTLYLEEIKIEYNRQCSKLIEKFEDEKQKMQKCTANNLKVSANINENLKQKYEDEIKSLRTKIENLQQFINQHLQKIDKEQLSIVEEIDSQHKMIDKTFLMVENKYKNQYDILQKEIEEKIAENERLNNIVIEKKEQIEKLKKKSCLAQAQADEIDMLRTEFNVKISEINSLKTENYLLKNNLQTLKEKLSELNDVSLLNDFQTKLSDITCDLMSVKSEIAMLEMQSNSLNVSDVNKCEKL